jgi:hypothetical protein
MGDSTTKNNQKDQVIKHMVTVQVVHYHCSNCGEEKEEVKLCESCKAPMKVIQVIEKFGDEAEKFLENLKKQPNVVFRTGSAVDDLSENSVIGNSIANEEELKQLDELDSGYTPIKAKSEDDMLEEFTSLDGDGIFSSDDDDAPVEKRKDLEDLLLELDKDEVGNDASTDFGDDDLESFKDL